MDEIMPRFVLLSFICTVAVHKMRDKNCKVLRSSTYQDEEAHDCPQRRLEALPLE